MTEASVQEIRNMTIDRTKALEAQLQALVAAQNEGPEDRVEREMANARALLAEAPSESLVDAASDIDRARREGWTQGMADTLKTIQSVGKMSVWVKCEVCPHAGGCTQCERDGECVVVHRASPSPSPSPAVRVAPFVDIVFDGPPGHESGRFIEVENDAGKSIRFGEWLQRPDGYWALRISSPSPPARIIDASLREALERAQDALKQMLGAIDGGYIDSEEIPGDCDVGVPPHRWHEEWAYYVRAALSPSPGTASEQ